MANQFKHYTPVVGRKESKRWAAPASTAYDGSGWGDDFDEEEEDEESVASASSQGHGGVDVDVHDDVHGDVHAGAHADDAAHDDAQAGPQGVLDESSSESGEEELGDTVDIGDVDDSTSSSDAEVDPRRNTTDFIYGYYESQPVDVSGTSEHETNHPYASLISDSPADFSDSTASLSTGRRSVASSTMDPPVHRFEPESNPRSSAEYQSELDQVPEHPEREEDAQSLDAENIEQERLESEIMQSFTPNHTPKSSTDSTQIDPEVVALYQDTSEILNRPISVYQPVEPLQMRQEMSDNSIRNILIPNNNQDHPENSQPPPLPAQDQHQQEEGRGRAGPDAGVDKTSDDEAQTPRSATPHAAASSSSPQIQETLPEIERSDTVTGPVAPRYRPEPVQAPAQSDAHSNMGGISEDDREHEAASDSEDNNSMRSSSMSREQLDHTTSHSREIDTSNMASPPLEQDSDIEKQSSSQHLTTDTNSSPDVSHDHKVSDSSELSAIQSDISKNSGVSAGISEDRNAVNNEPSRTQNGFPGSSSQPIQQKVRRPPQVDFTALLSSGGSESRYQQLRALRIREAEYSSGLDTWIQNTYASVDPGTSVYANGKPPHTQEAKQNVGKQVSTAVSSAIGHTRTKGTFGRVGEKSRGFFAKGRKFLRAGDG